jgi:hypothetical protein
MQAKRFDTIARMLDDGAWRALADLRDVTSMPDEWVEELQAEGLIETREQIGNVLVRLRNPRRMSSSA